MAKKVYRRNNITLSDNDYKISGLLNKLSIGLKMSKREVVLESLLLLLSKHKNISKKFTDSIKENQRYIRKCVILHERKRKVHDTYEISNINSRLFDLCSKKDQNPKAIFLILKECLKVKKEINPKILKCQKQEWDKLKLIGIEEISDYQANILMLFRRGFTLKQIKKISTDYYSFKKNLEEVSKSVVVFKKRNI